MTANIDFQGSASNERPLEKPLVKFHGQMLKTFSPLPKEGRVLEIAKRILVVVIAPLAYLGLGLLSTVGDCFTSKTVKQIPAQENHQSYFKANPQTDEVAQPVVLERRGPSEELVKSVKNLFAELLRTNQHKDRPLAVNHTAALFAISNEIRTLIFHGTETVTRFPQIEDTFQSACSRVIIILSGDDICEIEEKLGEFQVNLQSKERLEGLVAFRDYICGVQFPLSPRDNSPVVYFQELYGENGEKFSQIHQDLLAIYKDNRKEAGKLTQLIDYIQQLDHPRKGDIILAFETLKNNLYEILTELNNHVEAFNMVSRKFEDVIQFGVQSS